MADVKPRKGGKYSLYCYACKSWIPNTANHEMKREGYYSHSHGCYMGKDGKLYDRESGNAVPDEGGAVESD